MSIINGWGIFASVHIFSLGIIQGLNPYWPIWLEQWVQPDSVLYSVFLATIYTIPLISGAYSVSYWGRFVDRFCPILNWARSLACLGISLVGLSVVSTLFAFLAVRFIQGLVAGILPASQHLAIKLDSKNGLFRLQAASAISSILGPIWVGWLLAYWDFNVVMIYTGGALVCIATFIALYKVVLNRKVTSVTVQDVRSVAENFTRFIVPKIWYFQISFSHWVVVPVLSGLTLTLTETSWWIALVYCALPFGILSAQPIWRRCPGVNRPLVMVFSLMLVTCMISLQFVVDHIVLLCLLRFFTGLFVAPLVPWALQSSLKKHQSEIRSQEHKTSEKAGRFLGIIQGQRHLSTTSAGLALGLIQRQKYFGMATGLVLGSFLVTQPVTALALSGFCYVSMSFLFIKINFKSIINHAS